MKRTLLALMIFILSFSLLFYLESEAKGDLISLSREAENIIREEDYYKIPQLEKAFLEKRKLLIHLCGKEKLCDIYEILEKTKDSSLTNNERQSLLYELKIKFYVMGEDLFS